MFKIIIPLIIVILFTACSTTPEPKLGTYYKRNLEIAVNGQKFYGSGVANATKQYDIEVKSDGRMDALVIDTCHRNDVKEKEGYSYSFNYIPDPIIEIKEPCPMKFQAIEERRERNAYGFLAFHSPSRTLPARVSCNGYQVKAIGTAVCDGKQGTIQQVTFEEKVLVDDLFLKEKNPGSICALDNPTEDFKAYRFHLPKGECVFGFMSKERKKFELHTYGYEDFLLRKK